MVLLRFANILTRKLLSMEKINDVRNFQDNRDAKSIIINFNNIQLDGDGGENDNASVIFISHNAHNIVASMLVGLGVIWLCRGSSLFVLTKVFVRRILYYSIYILLMTIIVIMSLKYAQPSNTLSHSRFSRQSSIHFFQNSISSNDVLASLVHHELQPLLFAHGISPNCNLFWHIIFFSN